MYRACKWTWLPLRPFHPYGLFQYFFVLAGGRFLLTVRRTGRTAGLFCLTGRRIGRVGGFLIRLYIRNRLGQFLYRRFNVQLRICRLFSICRRSCGILCLFCLLVWRVLLRRAILRAIIRAATPLASRQAHHLLSASIPADCAGFYQIAALKAAASIPSVIVFKLSKKQYGVIALAIRRLLYHVREAVWYNCPSEGGCRVSGEPLGIRRYNNRSAVIIP